MAGWHDRSATAPPPSPSLSRLSLTFLCLLTVVLRLTSALQTVAGSPCESVCADAGTLEEDVVCLDADYQSLPQGRAYQNCVACQLNSTWVDTSKNETDVEWALLALRYILSGCMFAWPSTHISISSPCQVSCALLNESIEYQITNDTSKASPELGFCNVGAFDSTDINRCAFCYSFIPQQLYLANFLQALHIACVQPPLAGKAFFPDAAAIFNETLIAGPAPSSNNGGSGGGLHGWKLALAIALPIVGGILLIGGTCWCCFAYTRKRRQRMAQTGRMSRIHDANADHMYSPMSAKAMDAWSQGQPPTEMHAISPTLLHAKHPSPGMAQGRWSHHQAQGEESDHGTPLRTSFQQPEDIGPGNGQLQDPHLHEQYFGSTDEQDAEGHFNDLPGPSGAQQQQQQQYYHPEAIGVAYGQPHVPMQNYERGHFI